MHLLALIALLPAVPAFEGAAQTPLTDVGSAFPAAETVVPQNGRLLLFGGTPQDLSFVRTRGDGGEETLAHTTVAVDSFQSAHIVALPAELVVGETLVVSARCETCTFSGAWTVVEPDQDPPTFDDGPAAVEVQPLTDDPADPLSDTSSYLLTVRLPGARDARGPVAVALRGDVVNTLAPSPFAPGAPMTVSVQVFDGQAQTVCFDAVAIDSAGNEVTRAPELCAALVPAAIGGCAQTSPSTSMLAVLVLALLSLVRPRALPVLACAVSLLFPSANAHAVPAMVDAEAPRALAALPQVDIAGAVPSDGSSIPQNARLLVFGTSVGDQQAEVVFERFFGLDKTSLAFEVFPGAGLNEVTYLVDLGELVPGELVQVGCSLCFQNWTATVGDDVDDEPPTFGVGNKNRIGVIDMGEAGYQARACVPGAAGAVALHVVTDTGDAFARAAQGGCSASEVEVAAFAVGEPRTFCWQTLAVDAAGNEALFHEDVCVELPEHTIAPGGCSQGGASSWAPMALALALLRRRARRCR